VVVALGFGMREEDSNVLVVRGYLGFGTREREIKNKKEKKKKRKKKKNNKEEKSFVVRNE
jgi:hypothetical protein